jgi:transcriptional regulator with XRE-family HTH domain
MPTLGERIVALRKRKGLTAAEAARRIGISHPNLSKIEKGLTQSVKPETRARLARAYECTAEELGAYLDGYLELDALEPDPNRRTALEVCLEFHGMDRWPSPIIKVARKLQAQVARHLMPPAWVEMLDDMVAVAAVRPMLWERLIDPYHALGADEEPKSSEPVKEPSNNSPEIEKRPVGRTRTLPVKSSR